MMDTASFLADYRLAFQFKAVSFDLLPVTRRLYLLNHYITYCQTNVLHHTTGAETLAQELAALPPTPPLYQERTLTVIRHRVEEWEARQQQIVSGVAESLITAHLSIFRAIREGRLAAVTDIVERVLERKPITFAQWVQENAALFR